MFPARVYAGQIIAVFAIVIVAIWGATQWAAAALGNQAALGPAWFAVSGFLVYLPWHLFEWWYAYDVYAPHVFEQAGAIAAGGGVAGALFAVLNWVWRARQTKLVTTYGSARWANVKEIVAAGLYKPKGVFLGRVGDAYLRHDGPEHVICFAPTRSGKGVGLVLPTLLAWTSSAVVHDIKGENWQLTAGWRSKFSHCLLFDPTNPNSARCNPLLEVRRREVVYGGHEALLELLFGGDADVAQDRTGELGEEALDEVEPGAILGVKVNSNLPAG